MWDDEKSRRDKSGKRWNFRYWLSHYNFEKLDRPQSQRLFFWDDKKTECGLILFFPGSTRPYSQIMNLIDKLVADPALRKQHLRELRFPLERYYSEYGAVPEEISN